ncbi:MAG: hypothetical protein QHH04_03735 [Methanolinea sp.]|nr:hypothetical protein [Methanolinea sp.]
MQESTVRVILLVVIMAFGTLMLLFPVPLFYLLLGAVALALLVLFLTGTIRMPSLKRKKKAEPAGPKPGKEQKAKKVKEKKEKKPKPREGGRKFPEIISSLKKAFAVLGRDLKKARFSRNESPDRAKKIDTLLDQTVRGEEVASLDDIVPDAVPAEKKKAEDPFSALVGEDLNPDLLGGIEPSGDFSIPGDEDLGIEIPTQDFPAPDAGVQQMDLSLTSDETPIAIDETNDADEVKEILEAHKDEIEMPATMEIPLPEEDLGGLDNLDLEGIEIEEEGTSPQPAAPVSPGGGTAPAAKGAMATPAPTPAAQEQKVPASLSQPETDMLSFGTGKREDDDLMASLKSEAKVKKKSEYASLIRDLKDIRVNASDLQKELEDLLKPRKPGTR